MCFNCDFSGHFAQDVHQKKQIKKDFPRNYDKNATFISRLNSDSVQVDWILNSAVINNFCYKKNMFQNFSNIQGKAVISERSTKIQPIDDIVLKLNLGNQLTCYFVLNIAKKFISVKHFSENDCKFLVIFKISSIYIYIYYYENI